jgi:hypothetical protein
MLEFLWSGASKRKRPGAPERREETSWDAVPTARSRPGRLRCSGRWSRPYSAPAKKPGFLSVTLP